MTQNNNQNTGKGNSNSSSDTVATIAKNSYIKEYKKVKADSTKELPQTGEAESLAATLMGMGLIGLSGAALLKKKYSI